jgi:hypothetical protein
MAADYLDIYQKLVHNRAHVVNAHPQMLEVSR